MLIVRPLYRAHPAASNLLSAPTESTVLMVAHRRSRGIRLWCIPVGKRYDIAIPKGRIRSVAVGKDLSMREQAVLALLRQGRSNKEMSAALGISTRTVQTYLRRIYWHLGVQTRAEAIVALYEKRSRGTGT